MPANLSSRLKTRIVTLLTTISRLKRRILQYHINVENHSNFMKHKFSAKLLSDSLITDSILVSKTTVLTVSLISVHFQLSCTITCGVFYQRGAPSRHFVFAQACAQVFVVLPFFDRCLDLEFMFFSWYRLFYLWISSILKMNIEYCWSSIF